MLFASGYLDPCGLPNLFRGLGFSGSHSRLGGGDDWKVPSKSERLGVQYPQELYNVFCKLCMGQSAGADIHVTGSLLQVACAWFQRNLEDLSMRASPQQLGKLYAL